MTNKHDLYSVEAEKALLSNLISDPEKIIDVDVKPSDFYDNQFGLIFEAFRRLYDKGLTIDIITIPEELKRMKKLRESGGRNRIVELSEGWDNTNIKQCSDTIKDYSRKRSVLDFAERLKIDVSNGANLSSLVSKMSSFSIDSSNAEIVTSKDWMSETFQFIADSVDGERSGIKVLPPLDNKTNGLGEGNLVLVAGRPAMGKTAVMLQMALNAATGRKDVKPVPVGLFSLEMPREEIGIRCIANISGVDKDKVCSPNLLPHDSDAVGDSLSQIGSLPIVIDDTPRLPIEELRIRAHKMKKKHDIKILFIDYLQLIQTTDRFTGLNEKITLISGKLKALARELKIPIVCLSQLSRSVENRDSKIPNMSDLRDSGSLEQDADMILMVYRYSYYKGEDLDNDEIVLYIRKFRNGKLGDVPLKYKKNIQKIY